MLNYKNDHKLQKVSKTNDILDKKIQMIQSRKERVINEYIKKISNMRLKSNKRFLYNKENFHKLLSSWIQFAVSFAWISEINKKYQLKKHVKKHTDKLMKIFVVSWMAFARFYRIIRKYRKRILIVRLRSVISVKKSLWRYKHRIKMKKRFINFFIKFSNISSICWLIRKTTKALITLQRWYRRYLVKKYLMIGIMNYQWSELEYSRTRIRCIKTNLKST